MVRKNLRTPRERRGVITVLAALMLILMVGMVAFAVDVGNMGVARSQLQATADSAALAAASRITTGDYVSMAKTVASKNHILGRAAQVRTSDVEPGLWDAAAMTFTPSTSSINAVRVTVTTGSDTGGSTPMFFSRVLGKSSVDQAASAIATTNPRDIAFVIDLSASMNYNTRPSMASSSTAKGYIQTVYNQFGFGTCTETLPLTTSSSPSGRWAGYPITSKKYNAPSTSLSSTQILANSKYWVTAVVSALSSNTYKNTIYYTGSSSLSSDEKVRRAFAWVIDVQIGTTYMPKATPKPDSTNTYSFQYWKDYLNWSPTDNSVAPYKAIGYASYVQYMMVLGRDGVSDTYEYYTPLSVNSSDCPYHTVSTDAGNLLFPPEEMPTHAARIAIIDAIKIVKDRNEGITNRNQRDWVSIVTYDRSNGSRIVRTLTDDYDAAIDTCRTLQACCSGGACTETEGGMIAAHDHIQATTDGGSGRQNVNKILVLLTDGAANLKQSSNSTISAYVAAHPSSYWLTNTSSSNYWAEQAALMQACKYMGNRWYTYAVGLGLDIDETFMDKLASIAGTANKDGKSMSSTNPETAIADLKKIFSEIVTRPKLRLVK